MNYNLNTDSILLSPASALIIIACLVAKLGGKVVVTQADIDTVAFNMLTEDTEEGVAAITLELAQKPLTS